MATFSFSQLRALPKDMLVDVVIPMLARESPEEQLQRWAVQFATWYEKYHAYAISNLPGCHPYFAVHIADGLGHGVGRAAVYFFAVLGASESMPFFVYSALCGADKCIAAKYASAMVNRVEMTKAHPRFIEAW